TSIFAITYPKGEVYGSTKLASRPYIEELIQLSRDNKLCVVLKFNPQKLIKFAFQLTFSYRA
ncbi:hypothetical protein, partial [Plesiomonas shigelloides]|uniref:hypothetical protein n=1 Tax=Plesiomonas shigelloides TaxID=703 RepID=UPI001C49AD2D